MKSIELFFALKKHLEAVFAAIQGKYCVFEALGPAGLSRLCSIFYGGVVKKNEQG
jgi:hypothetical protein